MSSVKLKWLAVKKFSLIIIFVVFSTFLVYNYSIKFQQFGVQNLNHSLIQNQILIYTKYYFAPWNDIFTGEPIFTNNRCLYTTDHSALMTSSAVIFHLRDVRKISDLPKIKVQNQKWIIYNIESPMGNRRWDELELFKNIAPHFDLTMTYRSDSDIAIPYGRMVRNSNNSKINIEINFQQKSKEIAWFVSNCESFSKREVIVEKIRKLIPIDIYGKCGTLSCPLGGYHLFKNERCYEMLMKNYKFYLAFENSVCTDYVTEKLFNILNYDVIPIVYGGANYAHILPPNSYIDVRNFTSPEQLVKYLHYVGNNETIYKSYFEWRKYFHVEFDFSNKLCDLLLDGSLRRKEKRDIFNWWFNDTCSDLSIWS